MKHTWKKTIAFVMAFGLVTSAMPPSMGMYRAETSRSIVAHADVQKPLAQGVEYYVGDTIVIPEEANEYYFFNCGTDAIQIKRESYTLPDFTYYEDKDTHVFRTVDEFLEGTDGNFWELVFDKDDDHTSDDKVIGIKCVQFDSSGCRFEPIFEEKANINNAKLELKGSTVTVSYDGGTLEEGKDYTITYFDSNGTPIPQPQLMGTYYYQVKGIGNYGGETQKKIFTLDARVMTASLTLTDGFEINFFTSIPAEEAEHYSVKFNGKCYEADNELHELQATTGENPQLYATANLNANDINEQITVKFYYDGDLIQSATFECSVNDYLDKLTEKNISEDYNNMAFVTKFYGLSAENYFNNETNNIAEIFETYKTFSEFTDDEIKARAGEICTADTILPELQVSLVLNSKAKLRVYHDDGENLGIYGKYSEVTGLTPITMGQSQTVAGYNLSGYTWVNRVLNNSGANQKNTDMAHAMFAYMDTAVKFKESQEQGNQEQQGQEQQGQEQQGQEQQEQAGSEINLGELTGDYTAQDGEILTGENSNNYNVTIAENATVTLKGVKITKGLVALGDATIILEDENSVGSMDNNQAGIFVPGNKTLTIMGNGELTAISGYGAGIGSGREGTCGNIVIAGGTVTAEGYTGAGIGSGEVGKCGNIVIAGGTVTAKSYSGAGIGSGRNETCGNIVIAGGTVTADSNTGAGIGSGYAGKCGAVTIKYGTVTAKGYFGAGIGSGSLGKCGAVTIYGTMSTNVTAKSDRARALNAENNPITIKGKVYEQDYFGQEFHLINGQINDGGGSPEVPEDPGSPDPGEREDEDD